MPKIEAVDPDGNLVTLNVRYTTVSTHDGTRKTSTRVALPVKDGFSTDPAAIAGAKLRIAERAAAEREDDAA